MGEETSKKNTRQDSAEYKPTPERLRLHETMMEPESRFWSISEICRRANVDRQTYYNAFDDPRFVEWHLAQVKKLPARYAAKTMHAFGKEAERGSYQHGAAILDATGVYSPKQKVEHTGVNGGPIEIISPNTSWQSDASE